MSRAEPRSAPRSALRKLGIAGLMAALATGAGSGPSAANYVWGDAASASSVPALYDTNLGASAPFLATSGMNSVPYNESSYGASSYGAAAANATLDMLDEAAKAAEEKAADKAFRRKVRTLLTAPWRTTLALLPPEVQCRIIVSAFKQLLAVKLSLRVIVTRRALGAAHLVGGAIPTHHDADSWYRTLAVDSPSLEGSVSLDAPASSQAWIEDVATLVAALPRGAGCARRIADLLQQAQDSASTASGVLLALQRQVSAGGRRVRSRKRRHYYYAHM